MRILSWNILRKTGATADDVAELVVRHRPDLVLLQEATNHLSKLPDLIGGHYEWAPMYTRSHGPAAWSLSPFETFALPLPVASWLDLPIPPSRTRVARHAMIISIGSLRIANVHLDHGQRANRRQLRRIAARCNPDMIIGDFNALGPTTLPGFIDAGPRRSTHFAYGILPLRLDRCLLRNLSGHGSALAYGRSDHRPILIDFDADGMAELSYRTVTRAPV